MKFQFYSVQDMRENKGKGLALARSLCTVAPETFRDFIAYLVLPPEYRQKRHDSLCGLFVRSENDVVQSVAVLAENKVDRIYTLPRFRGKGYAKEILIFLKGISMIAPFSFQSPVNPDILPLFLSAQWVLGGENKDGTRQMIAHPPNLRPVMDMGRWAEFLKVVA